MHSLETRVQGLELALDEISYDLAVSNGRMSSNRNNCCLIPPGSFITSKFWKKPVSAPRLATYRNRNAQTMGLQGSRQRFNGPAGFIVNPLAEIRPDNVSVGMLLYSFAEAVLCLVNNIIKKHLFDSFAGMPHN